MTVKVLNIASILPYPELESEYKLKENDFLITLSKYLQDKDVESDFLKITTYSNRMLARINKKWEAFFKVPEEYMYGNQIIRTIKSVSFPRNKFKMFCTLITLQINKKKLCKIVEENNYTCIHAHSLLVGGSIAHYLYKKYNIPYVLTVRKEEHYFKDASTRFMANKIIRNAEIVLTTNMVNKVNLENYVNRQVQVITHGVSKENIYADLNVNNPVEIITICKLNKGKRIDLLIEALKRIDNKKFKLKIVGDGPEIEKLKEMSKSLLNCEFLGEIEHSEVINLLKKSDIFVLPSEYESFGRVYIEAMASSNAVIAVKQTGVFGLFKENEEILYMNHNSEDSLREILEKLIYNPENIKELKEKGFWKIKEGYSWEAIAGQYSDIYENVPYIN